MCVGGNIVSIDTMVFSDYRSRWGICISALSIKLEAVFSPSLSAGHVVDQDIVRHVMGCALASMKRASPADPAGPTGDYRNMMLPFDQWKKPRRNLSTKEGSSAEGYRHKRIPLGQSQS